MEIRAGTSGYSYEEWRGLAGRARAAHRRAVRVRARDAAGRSRETG